MKVTTEVEIETRVVDSTTGKLLKTQRAKNLVLDSGLNVIAKSSTNWTGRFAPSQLHTFCLIGSGNTANSINSGSITFTQSSTTLTASSGFFTAGMVGALFKYGTGSGGTEVYITAFTSSTQVTVGTSGTVSTPTVGTVWFVGRTTLDTFLFISNTYQTTTGDCGSTVVGTNQITHKRTFIFPQQGSPYTVNEIGYAPASTSNKIAGRLVLGSSDVVGTSNFYVVVINITLTYTPGTPTAVANVGTNINTAGNIAIEALNVTTVSSSGGNALLPVSAANSALDDTAGLVFKTATYTQNTNPSTTAGLTGSLLQIGSNVNWVFDATRIGSCTMTFTASTTTTGQSLFGIGISSTTGGTMFMDIQFSSTQTAPSGTFQPNTIWRLTYSRTLVN